MASVGVVPDHSSDEQIEKGNEELKTIEQGVIPSSKENKVIDVDEKTNAEESVSVKAPPGSEQEVANIQIVPSAIADAEKVEKFDEAPDSDALITDDSQVGVSPDSKLDISSVPESVVEAVENKPEESSKVPEVTESSIEALEKPVEHLEASPTKDSQPEVGKEPEEVSVVEPKLVEESESVVEVESKPQEQSQVLEEKSEELDPKESVDKDITIDGGTEADDSLKEEVSIPEPEMVEKPELVVEAVGKPQEAEEMEEKSETLKPKESIDNNSGRDGETNAVESLKEEVSVVEPNTLEKSESVIEMGIKQQEQDEEVEKKYEMLEPGEIVDKDITFDRETGVNGSLKEEVSVLEPKTIEKPDSVVEAVRKPQEAEEMEEKSETLKPKASTDTDSGKDQETNADESSKEEVCVVEPKKVEKSEYVIEMGIKPQEQAEVVEKKSEMLEPKESMDGDVTKDEATTIDMVKKYAEPLKEEEVTKDLDLVASESYTVACAGQEAESGLEEDGIRSVTPDVVENVSADETKKEVEVDEKAVVKMGDSEAEKEEKVANVEESNDKDVKIEELTQPERTEIIEGKEAKDMNIDENAENNVRTEELMLPEPMKTKDVGGSYAGTEVAEKPSEEQSASRDVETVIEEKKEQEARVDTLDSNGNVDVVDSTSVVNELTRESKENVIEGKVEEAIQSCVDNNEDKTENVVEETAKSGAPNVELSKVEDKSETDQVPPKQEVPAEAPQKQSSSIISKVKQSIVKVKRAIIGKSPSSKTLSSEAKDDIQVK